MLPDGDARPAGFRQDGWTRLAVVLPPARVPHLRDEVLAAPMRRVTVGDSVEHWSECTVAPDSALARLLAGDEVFALAQAAVDVRLKPGPAIWAQVYKAGERIAWHCDDEGEVQFLLCLDAPPADQGGVFCMRVNAREIRLTLAPGDAVLFRASRIAHSTTRLLALPGHADPRRITAVARFFAI